MSQSLIRRIDAINSYQWQDLFQVGVRGLVRMLPDLETLYSAGGIEDHETGSCIGGW